MTTGNKPAVSRLADMCAAMGGEPRLKILRLLLAAQPDGLVVGDIHEELGIPASTLSHHLEKLRIAGLVNVRRERTYKWYSANAESLEELLAFLYEECCSRNQVVDCRCFFPPQKLKRNVKESKKTP